MAETRKSCKECGGEVIYDEFAICIDCGIVQESKSSVANSELSYIDLPTNTLGGRQTVSHYEDNFNNSKAYKSFKDMYSSITWYLNSSYTMVEKGRELLSKLYTHCRYFKMDRKFSLLCAMIYCLYKQENNSGSAKQFQEKVSLAVSDFNKALHDVKEIFNFPASFKNEDLLINAMDKLGELSEIVLKPGARQLVSQAELTTLAGRLVQVIHARQWIYSGKMSSLCYVKQVSVVSIVLAGHYHVASILSRKGKNGNKKCFRHSSLEMKALAHHVSITERTLWKWTKIVQDNLFEIYNDMLLKPGNVKKSYDIGKVLKELLDYVDLDIDVIIKDEKSEKELERLSVTKSFLLKGLQQFITDEKLELNCKLKWDFLVEKLKIFQEDHHKELNGIRIELKADAFISIDDHKFHIQHLELMRDLLIRGCSVEELEKGQISNLCRRYIESQEELDVEIDEDEIDGMIKKPHEIGNTV